MTKQEWMARREIQKLVKIGLFFFIFVFSTVVNRYVHLKLLLLTGNEPRAPGMEATSVPTESLALSNLVITYFAIAQI